MKPPHPAPIEPASADRVFPSHHVKCGSIQVPLWLRTIGNLSAGARLVYGTLVWAAGSRKAVSGHGVTYLAAAAGLSERSFQRHLKELELEGLIRRAAPVADEVHHRYHFLRHEGMFMDEDLCEEYPHLVAGQTKTPHGYKATPRYIRGVITWIGENPHRMGWGDPRRMDDD